MRRVLPVLIGALSLSACDLVDALLRRGLETTLNQQESEGVSAPLLAPTNLPAFFDCLRERGQAVVAAHRGGPGPGLAENSILTFAHTISQAPALLEIDISETSDGALVLMHDDKLERTTEGHGAIHETSLRDLQALLLRDANGDLLVDHAPTLREALAWATGKAVLELDVKQGVSYEDVVAEVRAANAENRVIFITYSDDAAVRVHRLAPELMLSVSIDDVNDLDALEARGIDLTRVLAWTGTEAPNAALNLALAERGVEAMFGTLGNPERSWDGRFARAGVEQYAAFAESGLALIATDRPLEAVRDLDAADGVDGYGALQCLGAE
jgi:glycerophosphoryl diester phosphodiesterase